jgi:hypothetical protein
MIMTRLRITLFALVLLAAAPALAQTPASVAGDWDLTINSPQGANTVRVNFKQDGEKVSGMFKSQMGEVPFTGTMTGNDLKFGFAVPMQGTSLEITLTGKVEPETAAGKADFGGMAEGDWTAKRAVATSTSTTTAPSTATPAAPGTTTSTSTAIGFSGKWDVMLKTPAGDFPASANLIDEGGKLSGTFGSQMGEVQVSGTSEGKAMKLTMVAVTPQGNMTVVLTGDLDGDSIVNGKADVEGMGQLEWTAKRAKQ